MREHIRSVSSETLGRVLEVLKREADMDGIITTTDAFVAKELSLSAPYVWLAVQFLIENGDIVVLTPRGSWRKAGRVLQLSEEHLS